MVCWFNWNRDKPRLKSPKATNKTLHTADEIGCHFGLQRMQLRRRPQFCWALAAYLLTCHFVLFLLTLSAGRRDLTRICSTQPFWHFLSQSKTSVTLAASLDCEERDWGDFVESQNSLPHNLGLKGEHLKNIFLPQTKRWKVDTENLCSKWSKSLQGWRLQIPYRSDGGGDVHGESTEDVPKWDNTDRFQPKCFDFVKSMPKWESTRLTQNTFGRAETHCSGDVCRFHMDRRWHGQRHSKVRQSPPSSLLVILWQ